VWCRSAPLTAASAFPSKERSKPRALPAGEYQARLGDYLRNFCHRNPAAGWKADKRVRDTGSYTATLQDGQWTGRYHGTHAPVVVWYSKEMMGWLKVNRPDGDHAPRTPPPPVPDGAIMVKEMFPAPAAACGSIDPVKLLPTTSTRRPWRSPITASSLCRRMTPPGWASPSSATTRRSRRR
jgi:hypothetical protein